MTGLCPCGKKHHPTKSDAKREQKWIKKNAGGRQSPVRFYECEHGSWHWTHRNPARKVVAP